MLMALENGPFKDDLPYSLYLLKTGPECTCLNLFSRVQHVCPICQLESRLSVIPDRRSTMRRGPEEVVTVIAVGRATTCAERHQLGPTEQVVWDRI